MDDHNRPDQNESDQTQESESPLFVHQENEGSSSETSPEYEALQGSASPLASQSPAGQEDFAIDPDDVIDLSALAEANLTIDEERDAEAGSGDPDEEEADSDQVSARDEGIPEVVHVPQRALSVNFLQKRCNRQQDTITKKIEQVEKQKETIRELQGKLRALKAKDGRLATGQQQPRRRPRGAARSTAYTWIVLLRRFLGGDLGVTYNMVWKQSQRELNMPINPQTIHPDIRLLKRGADEPMDGNSPPSSPVVPAVSLQNKHFRLSFDDLPREALCIILENLLWFDGSLIHCLSRLDPFVPPVDFPSDEELGDTRTGLKGRFFISSKQRVPLSLTHDTIDPNKVLAPLSVCRRWAWYGIHIFYGRNTFAFSSLGEWDRWCNGSKVARVQRLQVSHCRMVRQGFIH